MYCETVWQELHEILIFYKKPLIFLLKKEKMSCIFTKISI